MHKILFLVQLPPPVHGASAVNESIKNSELVNSSFATAFFNISPAKDLSDIGKLSVGKLISSIKIFSGSLRLFLTFRPDLVYITLSPHGLAFYKDGFLVVALKMLGARVVFHMHGKGIEDTIRKSRIKKIIYRSVFKNVHIIHLSDKLFYDLDNVRDLSTSLTAIPNGIDNALYGPCLKEKHKLKFVYLSNLVRAKGADTLIRASALINKQYEGLFEVKIIGKSSSKIYSAELDGLLTKELAKAVTILGPKYGIDKIYELQSSDIFVLPTKNDCFPLSILEAMAAGLAVISTDEGAISDIVDHGITGEILPDYSPESLAAAMVKFIENVNYTRNCAQAGKKKFLLRYTQAIFEEKLVENLHTIIERR